MRNTLLGLKLMETVQFMCKMSNKENILKKTHCEHSLKTTKVDISKHCNGKQTLTHRQYR